MTGPAPTSIFSFDPSSFTYTILNDFHDTLGSDFPGSLMEASNGKLYGVTTQGGNLDLGVIFSFDPVSSAYEKLKDLHYTPCGSLMQASDGKLYGMTSSGGNS